MSTRIPSYRKHRPSGQAVVTLNGKDHYLGPHGTSVSKRQYDAIIRQWIEGGRVLRTAPEEITVGEIVLLYVKHAKEYYRRPDGTPTGAHERVIRELGPLVKLYKTLPAIELGPLRLKTIRNWMIEAGWVRTSINHAVSTIRSCMKWAVANELLPGSVMEGLRAVIGLKPGRSKAVEPKTVTAVPSEVVALTLPHLPPMLAVAVRIQQLTGMRSSEVLTMRTGDINRGTTPWEFSPRQHKTQHHDQIRMIPIGPAGRDLLTPLLKLDPDQFIFSPAESEKLRREAAHAMRRTPMSCGNSPGTNVQSKPRRKLGGRYTPRAYRRAIARAADQADAWAKAGVVISNDERLVERWHPHRLRHSAAVEIRKSHGPEAAQALMGHSSLKMAEHYARVSAEKASAAMEAVG